MAARVQYAALFILYRDEHLFGIRKPAGCSGESMALRIVQPVGVTPPRPNAPRASDFAASLAGLSWSATTLPAHAAQIQRRGQGALAGVSRIGAL